MKPWAKVRPENIYRGTSAEIVSQKRFRNVSIYNWILELDLALFCIFFEVAVNADNMWVCLKRLGKRPTPLMNHHLPHWDGDKLVGIPSTSVYPTLFRQTDIRLNVHDIRFISVKIILSHKKWMMDKATLHFWQNLKCRNLLLLGGFNPICCICSPLGIIIPVFFMTMFRGKITTFSRKSQLQMDIFASYT